MFNSTQAFEARKIFVKNTLMSFVKIFRLFFYENQNYKNSTILLIKTNKGEVHERIHREEYLNIFAFGMNSN